MPSILLAEDEDILRKYLSMILKGSGYQVFTASTTSEAIELFQKRDIDLLITDLVMPEKGGEELIRHVRANKPEVRVIIMTAYPTVDSAIGAVKECVADYFTKPFKTNELLESVSRILDLKKASVFRWEKLSEYGVTDREEEILRAMLDEGLTESRELVERFSIKTTTVKQHLKNLYLKFGVHNRSALISAIAKLLSS